MGLSPEEQLLFQRQSARLSELESWLGMMIIMFGLPTDSGWQFLIAAEDADAIRAHMPAGRIAVNVEYHDGGHYFVLDAL